MVEIRLSDIAANGRLLGTRPLALPVRAQVEKLLNDNEASKVGLDFAGTNPTQSFVDELVGVLVLEHGPNVLSRLVMKNCNDLTKSILHFVVTDRMDQYEEHHSLLTH